MELPLFRFFQLYNLEASAVLLQLKSMLDKIIRNFIMIISFKEILLSFLSLFSRKNSLIRILNCKNVNLRKQRIFNNNSVNYIKLAFLIIIRVIVRNISSIFSPVLEEHSMYSLILFFFAI